MKFVFIILCIGNAIVGGMHLGRIVENRKTSDSWTMFLFNLTSSIIASAWALR